MINTMTLRLKFSHFELRSNNVSFVSEAALYIYFPLYLYFPLPNKISLFFSYVLAYGGTGSFESLKF